MHRAALLIGGNQGDRHSLLLQATDLIRQRIGSVALLSSIHETEPWGDFEIQNSESEIQNFLNQALVVDTPLSPHDLLHEALAIEHTLGRRRKLLPPPSSLLPRQYSSRPIDIDIIFYDSEVIDEPDLTVPHPRMHLRRFVLEPLAEVMPDYVHPVLGKSVAEMLAEPTQWVTGTQAGVSTPAHHASTNPEPPQGVTGTE